MPTTEGIPIATVTMEEPSTPREVLVDSIAMEMATGSTVAQLATRFGYTYGGMSGLVRREDFQERVRWYGKRLEDMRHVAHKKLLLHLPNLLNSELAIALQGEDPATGAINIEIASKPASQKARHYLVDKVLPTTTRVEQTTETINSPEQREVLVGLRRVLDRVVEERRLVGPTYDILASPHILEGVDALPSPLLAKKSDE